MQVVSQFEWQAIPFAIIRMYMECERVKMPRPACEFELETLLSILSVSFSAAGLMKLQTAKRTIEVLVVDHADRPSEN
jgi:hypothetical protein